MPYCYPGGKGPVKDFVRDVWKVSAACSFGAFLLSLVIGLIAGNPFGVVIFRALLLALLFAALGAGLRFVVKAYLPELITSTSSPAGMDEGMSRAGRAGKSGAEGGADRRGAAVDIVLPDDDGLRRQTYGGSGGAPLSGPLESGAANMEDVGDAALEASLDQGFMSQGDPPGLGEVAELTEELPSVREPAGTGGSAVTQVEKSAEYRGAEGAESAGYRGAVEETESGDELPRTMRESSGGVDSLPDIEGLEPPEEKPARAPLRVPRPAEGEKPGDAVRIALSGQDPATLARAIRTALKNAEKG
jgi:hypothetical protein